MKKKKIGIVTITNSEDNYGNMLQNYALTKVLQNLGYSVETIYNLYGKSWRKYDLYIIPKLIIQKKAALRPLKFFLFRKKHLNYTKFFVDEQEKSFEKVKSRYYKIICGSDQIWNPIFDCNQNWKYGLLEFAKPEQKISYAASIGVTELTHEHEIRFKNSLSTFQHISVREDDGADLVYSLTGERPEVHVDPTMLLNEKEWDKVAKKVKGLKPESYVLKYVLGDFNEQTGEYISEKNKYDSHEVIDLLDKTSIYYNSDPGEFVWLIKNAKEVITDSFHATVFSIIYRKDFVVFQRLGKHLHTFGRLRTLLTKFNLENHVWNKGDCNPSFYDESFVCQQLNKERQKSIRYLTESIEN